jgi:hypothetical protein
MHILPPYTINNLRILSGTSSDLPKFSAVWVAVPKC